jgi:hypothetical protein
MALPFHVFCNARNPRLYPIGQHQFHQLDRGVVGPFVAGRGYLLVENSLAQVLMTIGITGVRLEPAVLYDPRTGTEHRTHTAVVVEHSLREDEIQNLASEGPHLFLWEGVYLVSPALREVLEREGFSYLKFSSGFPVMLK